MTVQVMYHEGQGSITFDEIKTNAAKYRTTSGSTTVNIRTERNTWTDWFLIPTSRPAVKTPTVKTSSIEIPGANGLLDTTEALTGYPLYGNSAGSFEFIVDILRANKSWIEIYDELKTYFHGRELNMVLTDEPEYYYQGRFKVNQWKSDKEKNLVTIDYDIKPYRRSIVSTIDDWLWDPFNFNTGIVYDRAFKGIVVETEGLEDYQTFIFRSAITGNMPVVPKFYADLTTNPDPTELAMNLRVWNVYRQSAPVNVTIHTSVVSSSNDTVVRKGTLYDPSIIIMNIDEYDKVKIEFAGVGVVDIEFVPGRL